MHDSLYRNSIFLIADTAAASGLGFIFWLVATHLFTAQSVGKASGLIAVSNIIFSLSLLGFDSALIHYLPKQKRGSSHRLISLSISTLITSSLFLSVLFLCFIDTVSPELSFINSSVLSILLFILFMIINVLNLLTNYIFIAFRAAHLVLSVNVIYGVSRIVILVLMASMGLKGIIFSYMIGVVLALTLSLIILAKKFSYTFKPYFNKTQIMHMSKFMSDSYMSSIISGAPLLILPLLVLNKLGSDQAAYYYITATVSTLLNIIPSAISQSLFAEGSWGIQSLKLQVIKSLKFMYLLTIPLVVVLIFFGNTILSIFGKNYSSQGYELLVLISVTVLPKVISYTFSTIVKLSGRLKPLVIVSFIGALSVLTSSYFLMSTYGLLGIGYATLIGEILVASSYALILFFRFRNHTLISPKAQRDPS